MCNPMLALTVTHLYTYMYFTSYDNKTKNLETSNHNFGLKLIHYTQNIRTQKSDEKSNLHTGKWEHNDECIANIRETWFTFSGSPWSTWSPLSSLTKSSYLTTSSSDWSVVADTASWFADCTTGLSSSWTSSEAPKPLVLLIWGDDLLCCKSTYRNRKNTSNCTQQCFHRWVSSDKI